jgi:sulfur carrier protein ThiS
MERNAILPKIVRLAILLVLLDIVGRRVAVELNQDIVPKSQHSVYCVKDKVMWWKWFMPLVAVNGFSCITR